MYGTSATNRSTVPQLRSLSLQIDGNEGEKEIGRVEGTERDIGKVEREREGGREGGREGEA